MIILGIDPGSASGAIAALHPANPFSSEVIDLPTIGLKAKKRIDVHALADWIKSHKPGHCYFERAQAMPRQGSSSGFVYGRATGSLEAVVMMLNVPITFIEASAWKRHFRLKGGDKENARALAIQLWPHLASSLSRVRDHNRAESLLIAAFGMKTLGANPGSLAGLATPRLDQPSADLPGLA